MAELHVYETHNISDSPLPFIYHPAFLRIGPSSRINWHENIEFLFCTEGEGYIQCGAERYPFCQNDLFVVNADTLHTIGSQNAVTYQCLIVDRSFFESNALPVTTLYFQNRIRDPQIAQLFTDIADTYRSFDPADFCASAKIRCAVLKFILLLCQNYTTTRPALPSADTAVKEVIVYIRNNLKSPITLDLLSAHTGISKYHLSRQFKLATGKTIIEYMNLTRCKEAKHLIESGYTVSSAALACGFENLSYFSRTYKKLLGNLPSAVSVKHGL